MLKFATMNNKLISTCILLLILSLVGCGGQSEEPPNVLLIFIDTLRADRMSLYGHENETTPHIDRFAASGVAFERAYSPSSWTRASFASYFTGLYPSAHGCEGLDGMLDQAHLTLAERFHERGFATASIYANDNIAPGLGFDQGFDLYEHPPRLAGYPDDVTVADAAAVSERTLRWLRKDRPEGPWFLFVLMIDPHDPYLPHEEFAFNAPPLERPLGSRQFLERLKRPNLFRDHLEIRERVRLLYDGEIAFADHHVGRILAALEDLELADDTVVILSSDHGEGLWDHFGYRGHGKHVFEEQIHVPLVIRWPGRTKAGSRVAAPVAVLDVFGSLAEAYELGAPAEYQARSLLGLLEGDCPVGESLIFCEEKLEAVDYGVVIEWPWKLKENRKSGGRFLFQLEEDPLEQTTLFARHPDRAKRLLAVLDSLRQGNQAWREGIVFDGGVPQLTEEQKRELKTLGYVN